MAVVAEITPRSRILEVNRWARDHGVRPGQLLSVALGRVPALRAGEVSRGVLERTVQEIKAALHRFSPEVEPASELPGVFWIDATGLTSLFGSLAQWGRQLQEHVAEIGFLAGVAVGFTRFGTCAVARSSVALVVFDSPTDEHQRALDVGVSSLVDAFGGMDPRAYEALDKLGVHTLRDLVCLPGPGVKERYGPAVYDLHRQASGRCWEPLRPIPEVIPVEATQELEFPESDRQRLLFVLREMFPPLISTLRSRNQAVVRLVLTLSLEDGDRCVAMLKTAQPTQDSGSILELVRLRLENLELPAGVVAMTVSVTGDGVPQRQLALFEAACRRNLDAAHRALARLVAEHGDAVVVHARLLDGHLPQDRFAWEPLTQLDRPVVESHPMSSDVRGAHSPVMAVRRYYDRPCSAAAPGRGVRLHGPYRITSGWWSRLLSRDYYFADTPRGSIEWLYYDRIRNDWRMEGRLE